MYVASSVIFVGPYKEGAVGIFLQLLPFSQLSNTTMESFKPVTPSLKVCAIFAIRFGAVAQLARAFDWQSRGPGFDSP